jgi:hypothetical protein
MIKTELKPGDVVCLKHDACIKYTYLGEYSGDRRTASVDLKTDDYGVFAYNPEPTKELRTVILPYEAVDLPTPSEDKYQ